MGGGAVLEISAWGFFGLGMHLFDLEVSRAPTGTSKHNQPCSLQERTLHREICLLAAALPGVTWFLREKLLNPLRIKPTFLQFSFYISS